MLNCTEESIFKLLPKNILVTLGRYKLVKWLRFSWNTNRCVLWVMNWLGATLYVSRDSLPSAFKAHYAEFAMQLGTDRSWWGGLIHLWFQMKQEKGWKKTWKTRTLSPVKSCNWTGYPIDTDWTIHFIELIANPGNIPGTQIDMGDILKKSLAYS